MEKGRWLFAIIIAIGAVTVGRKKLEPLWDLVTDDPAMGALFVLIVIVLARLVIRVIRS